MTNLKEKTNIELARTALNCLEELENRGNRAIERARQDVNFFYQDILCLQSMAEAIEIEITEYEFTDEYTNQE